MTGSILTTVLAGISYDPEIRGVLITVVSVLILCGSVYLLLSTNIGARLGFQVALAGLFGWMTLLCVFWWIYGVGAIGELPSWRVEEVNVGDISQAQLEEARDLTEENLPSVEQIIEEHPEVAEQFDEGKTITLSEIAALPDLPPEVSAQLEEMPGDWQVLPQSAIGDAQAAADAALTSGEGGLPYASNAEYVLIDGFTRGGEPKRASDSLWDRFTNQVEKAVTIFNPTHHVVIQVQTSEATAVPPGNAPLLPSPDEDEPVVSVIMVRDLGSRRLPPAVMTFMFGALFAISCGVLHRRERLVREASGATAGS
jgi:hypothetical protein